MHSFTSIVVAALALASVMPALAADAGPASQAGGQTGGQAGDQADGKYLDANGVPTYHVAEDGTVDWYTYSGFRRYHSECHVCHGPDGLGSSFGPALTDSLQDIDYAEFQDIVAAGQGSVNAAERKGMPGFAKNPNVMCFVDDIYVYLRARSDEAIPRGRPAKKQAKPKAAGEAVEACMTSLASPHS